MAIRGRKPRPAHLKLLEGKSVKGGPDPAAKVPEGYDNGLKLPSKKASRRERELWDSFIRRAPWLSFFDEPRAFMWCSLQAEFEAAPSSMVAAKIAQLRALGSELGMDPSSRARAGFNVQPPRPSKFAGLLGGVDRPLRGGNGDDEFFD